MELRLKISPTLVSEKGTCIRSESCLESWKVRHQTPDFVWVIAFQVGASSWKVRGSSLETSWNTHRARVASVLLPHCLIVTSLCCILLLLLGYLASPTRWCCCFQNHLHRHPPRAFLVGGMRGAARCWGCVCPRMSCFPMGGKGGEQHKDSVLRSSHFATVMFALLV